MQNIKHYSDSVWYQSRRAISRWCEYSLWVLVEKVIFRTLRQGLALLAWVIAVKMTCSLARASELAKKW